jgi:lambda repressor-like predicted transcriptional regulator
LTKLEFKAEVKKQLTLRCWTYEDLSRETGYTQRSLQVIMSDDAKLSKPAIEKIAQVLGINAD